MSGAPLFQARCEAIDVDWYVMKRKTVFKTLELLMLCTLIAAPTWSWADDSDTPSDAESTDVSAKEKGTAEADGKSDKPKSATDSQKTAKPADKDGDAEKKPDASGAAEDTDASETSEDGASAAAADTEVDAEKAEGPTATTAEQEDGAADTSGSADGETSTSATAQPATEQSVQPAPLTAASLVGKWRTPCSADGGQFVRSVFEAKSDGWILEDQRFVDPGCQQVMLTARSKGTLKLPGESKGDGATPLELTFSERTITAHDERALRYLSSLVPCGGEEPIAIGEAKSVFEQGCPGAGIQSSESCSVWHTVGEVRDDVLFLGARSPAGLTCAADERPSSTAKQGFAAMRAKKKKIEPEIPKDNFMSSISAVKLNHYPTLFGSGQRIDFDLDVSFSSSDSGGDSGSSDSDKTELEAEYEYAFRQISGNMSYYGQFTPSISMSSESSSSGGDGEESSQGTTTLKIGGRGGSDRDKATVGMAYYFGAQSKLAAGDFKNARGKSSTNIDGPQTQMFAFADVALKLEHVEQDSGGSDEDSGATGTTTTTGDFFAGLGVGRLYPAAPYRRVKSVLTLFAEGGHLRRAVTKSDYRALLELSASRWDPTRKATQLTDKMTELGLIEPAKIGAPFGELVARTIEIIDGSYDYRDEGIEAKLGLEVVDLIKSVSETEDLSDEFDGGGSSSGGEEEEEEKPLRLKVDYRQTVPLTESTTFFPSGIVFYEIQPESIFFLNLNGTVSTLFTEVERRKSVLIPKEVYLTQNITYGSESNDGGDESNTRLNTVLGARYSLGSYLSAQFTLTRSSSTTTNSPVEGEESESSQSDLTFLVKLVAGGRGLGYEGSSSDSEGDEEQQRRQ